MSEEDRNEVEKVAVAVAEENKRVVHLAGSISESETGTYHVSWPSGYSREYAASPHGVLELINDISLGMVKRKDG